MIKKIIVKKTEDVAIQDEVSFGEKAWQLNEIIQGMNNEEAYFDTEWLYIWPDGESFEEAKEDFTDEEDYKELEELFIEIYKYYHDDGLYNVTTDVVNRAHEWDAKLGLDPIENIEP